MPAECQLEKQGPGGLAPEKNKTKQKPTLLWCPEPPTVFSWGQHRPAENYPLSLAVISDEVNGLWYWLAQAWVEFSLVFFSQKITCLPFPSSLHSNN